MGESHEAMKRRAAERALEWVSDGAVVGLGTGSTAAYAIDALGDAMADGLDITGVPTSAAARKRALNAGIPLASLDEVPTVDIAIDGADQLCESTLLKGGGGAHTTERIVADAAARFVVVADERKQVDRLDAPIPLEVIPSGLAPLTRRIVDRGGEPTLRSSDRIDGPAYTERGNVLLDVDFGPIDDPSAIARSLSAEAGVVDHGLFVDAADVVVIGRAEATDVFEY